VADRQRRARARRGTIRSGAPTADRPATGATRARIPEVFLAMPRPRRPGLPKATLVLAATLGLAAAPGRVRELDLVPHDPPGRK
jgi:hypothetical protein